MNLAHVILVKNLSTVVEHYNNSARTKTIAKIDIDIK